MLPIFYSRCYSLNCMVWVCVCVCVCVCACVCRTRTVVLPPMTPINSQASKSASGPWLTHVKGRQEAVSASHEQRDRRSHGGEDASQLDGDVPAADDDDVARLPLQLEEAVAGDDVLTARNFRQARRTTDSNQNVIRLSGQRKQPTVSSKRRP